MSVPTPHIEAKLGDFARTVLMPGDPLRSKYIAETFLENAKLVNNVRGIQGYTGTYNGKPVSVMASGMGMPSMGIYSYELFNFYDVDNIIRVGSAGSISHKLQLRDIVLGMGACSNSNFDSQFRLSGTFAPICSPELLLKAVEASKKLGTKTVIGNLYSHDNFYREYTDELEMWEKLGVLAIEMESAALYINAARAGKNALAICTVSDHLLTGEKLTSDERLYTFNEMIKLALEMV